VTRHVWDGTDSGKAYCGVAYDHDRDVVTARCSDCDPCKARHDKPTHTVRLDREVTVELLPCRDCQAVPIVSARRVWHGSPLKYDASILCADCYDVDLDADGHATASGEHVDTYRGTAVELQDAWNDRQGDQ
jgi:hypothetical protein